MLERSCRGKSRCIELLKRNNPFNPAQCSKHSSLAAMSRGTRWQREFHQRNAVHWEYIHNTSDHEFLEKKTDNHRSSTSLWKSTAKMPRLENPQGCQFGLRVGPSPLDGSFRSRQGSQRSHCHILYVCMDMICIYILCIYLSMYYSMYKKMMYKKMCVYIIYVFTCKQIIWYFVPCICLNCV